MTEESDVLHHDQLLRENEEEFPIVWFDANIAQSDDSVQTKNMLLQLNPAALFYTDSEHCIQRIETLADKQILLILSGSIAQTILPRIHPFQSILPIFIFCADQQKYESLKNNFKKIVAVVVNQEDLLESIRQTLNLLEQQAITFSLFEQRQKSSRHLSKESAVFSMASIAPTCSPTD